MAKHPDISGQKFGRLTAVKYIGKDKNRNAKWLFRCDCGNECISLVYNVKTGSTSSCGCYAKEKAASQSEKAAARAAQMRITHGQTGTRLYRIYYAMINRCYNPQTPFYKRYGGRGIAVCDDWRNDFQAFFSWACSNGYADDLSIDRIDNDKGYSPDNCRWATRLEQARNTRTNVYFVIHGKRMTMAEIEREFCINHSTFRRRLKRGVSPENAILKGAQ